MDLDADFSDVVSISKSDALALGLSSSDVLQLSATSGSSSGFPRDLVTYSLQIVAQGNIPTTEDKPSGEGGPPEVFVSPLMYEIMCTASAMAGGSDAGDDGDDILPSCVPVRVSPMAVHSTLTTLSEGLIDGGNEVQWFARKIQTVLDLPAGSSVNIRILYLDDEFQQFCEASGDFKDTLQSTISFFLGGRILMEGTTTTIHTEEGLAIVTVQKLQEKIGESDSSKNAADAAYRLGVSVDFELCIDDEDYTGPNSIQGSSQDYERGSEGIDWQSECPGYDQLVHSLVQLASIRGAAAPSGILLTGSPQVGKTHLASCVAHHLSRLPAAVHWVSVQDLLLQASWADEADLKKMLLPPAQPPSDQIMQVLILDDLHVFESQESSLGEDSVTVNMDQEMLVVKNAVVQVIDELWESKRADTNNNNKGAAVLGIAQSSSGLPPGFVKSGRLEKEVAMLPPTESQREKILGYFIPAVSVGTARDEAVFQKWAEALAPVTVGCVAGDLRRILSDAWTRALVRREEQDPDISQPLSWDDLQKAAQTYIPMQLQTVDVCKPKYPLALDEEENAKLSTDMEGWAEAHRLSWESFGGYPLVKKRLLRTVVVPWKLFLKSLDRDSTPSTTSVGLSPPPGVLLHGESGTGKSLAAGCLASSLGLPMIKVKAADVMDKWLGGSEAIIRGLFARARSAAPCILFFDELDSVATNRASGDEGGAEVMARLLSTLLNEMDGISNDKRRQSVLVVACTNRLEDLDAALLRPGRLEEHIELKRPGASDIRDILRVHLSGVPLSPHVDLDVLARYLAEQNASGAEVEGLCHTACLCAAHRAGTPDAVLMPEDIDSGMHSLA